MRRGLPGVTLRRLRIVVLVSALLPLACLYDVFGTGSETDGGIDAGVMDAGGADAGSQDAGEGERDAGAVDGGRVDAGVFDAGLPDAGCQADLNCGGLARFCSTGECVSCTENVECAEGQTCSHDGCSGDAGACSSDEDCGGGVCVPQPNQDYTAWVNQCQSGSAFGSGGGGGPCLSGSDCASGICHLPNGNGADGICIDACTSGADCQSPAQCPTNGVILYLPQTNLIPNPPPANAVVCWPPTCVRNRDCAGLGTSENDWSCDVMPDPLRPLTDLVQTCYPTIGTVAGGEPCSENSDCVSGRCQTWTNAMTGASLQECFGACVTDADCPSGVTCVPGLKIQGGEVGTVNCCVTAFP